MHRLLVEKIKEDKIMLRTDLPEIITETLPGPRAAEVIERRQCHLPLGVRIRLL